MGQILAHLLTNQIYGTVEQGLLALGGEVDGDGDVAIGEPFAFHRLLADRRLIQPRLTIHK